MLATIDTETSHTTRKSCLRCGKTKSLSDFTTSKKGKLGTSASCRECENKRLREYRREHPESRREYQKKWVERNRTRVNEEAKKRYHNDPTGYLRKSTNSRHEKQGEWYERNKDHVKNKQLLRDYGITLPEYMVILEKQGGQCAICGSGEPGGVGRFHVDHDHKTGKVRGLLCHFCNTGIGSLRDDPVLLRAAVEYLEK